MIEEYYNGCECIGKDENKCYCLLVKEKFDRTKMNNLPFQRKTKYLYTKIILLPVKKTGSRKNYPTTKNFNLLSDLVVSFETKITNVKMDGLFLTQITGERLDFTGPSSGPEKSLTIRTNLRSDGADLGGESDVYAFKGYVFMDFKG